MRLLTVGLGTLPGEAPGGGGGLRHPRPPADEAIDAQGVTRIVVGATATEPEQQRDELSAFAERFALLGHLSG
jgi:hypothetical protein